MSVLSANTGSLHSNLMYSNSGAGKLTAAMAGKLDDTGEVSSSLSGLDSDPVGDTYRGVFSDWFNAKNIAKEDFKRGEQAANNQFVRDLYMYDKQKEFAREQMSWEERMSNTSYQRAVEDMKKAGINPVMAINQGGAATPSAPSGGSAVRSGSRYSSPDGFNTTGLVASLISLVAGVYGTAAKNATSLAIAQMNAQGAYERSSSHDAMSLYRDDQWRNYYDRHRR